MRQVRDLSCGDTRIYLEVEVRRLQCRSCGGVKREELAFLADNPLYTKRFAYFVGRRCRQSTIKDVAKELHLHWETIKTLERQYMRAQLARMGTPAPRRLAVMDMWRPFYNVTTARAPQAAILYDKFHIMRHLSDALDEVRKSEYSRLSGKARSYIKGQKYTLLSNRENLSLKWQRLKPYEKFAEMIDRHWDGIAAYCKPENKVSLGFVEGFNIKIRVLRRRAYGLRDEEYLRLKVLTCMLPEL